MPVPALPALTLPTAAPGPASWTLHRVQATGYLSIECRRCQHVGRPDLDRLVARFGAAALVGTIMRAMVCYRCGSRAAEPLVYRIGIRGDRAWFPQPPQARR